MPKRSAGLLVYRIRAGGPEFLLAHPGGPFWKNRDQGVWSIPKGLVEPGEETARAAAREFEEEVGQAVAGAFVELAPQRQKSGKLVLCWMVEADLDLTGFKSNLIQMEWPPRSGRTLTIPEIDRVGYFAPAEAAGKILPGQRPFLDEALERLSRRRG